MAVKSRKSHKERNVKRGMIHGGVAAEQELMAVVGMLLHVRRVCHRTLMRVLRYRGIGLAKAEFDEHVLKIALILLRRMHTTTIHVVEARLIVVLHGSGIRVATTSGGVDVARSDNAIAEWHLVRVINILRLLSCWVGCGLDMGRGKISFTVRLGSWMGIRLCRRVLSGAMWIVLTLKSGINLHTAVPLTESVFIVLDQAA